MVEYLVTVNHGLAYVSAREVEDLTGRKPTVYSNYLRVDGSVEDAYRLVLWGRTIHKVMLILDEGVFRSLDGLGGKMYRLSYREVIFKGVRFSLRTVRCGIHNFTSVDVNKIVGGYIHRRLVDEGLEPKVDLDNPDVEFILRIVDDKYVFTVNLTGDSLHKRAYRKFKHPASIKPTIAAAMVMLSGWKNGNFIDPMAGGGTIPIEAALYKYNVAPGLLRRSHPLIKIKLFDEEGYEEFREEAEAKKTSGKLNIAIVCNDINGKYVDGARVNAEAAGVADYINFHCRDARLLHKYLNYSGGFVAVTNPPYGIRMSREKAIPNLYRDVFSSLSSIGVKRIVSITSKWRDLANAYEENGFKVTGKYEVKHGKLNAFILIGES